MDIRTKYSTNPTSGAGRITASGTFNGKRRQLTVPIDHSLSRPRRHGRAAAALVNKNADQAEQRRLATAITTVQASWVDNGNDGFVFTFPDN